VAEHIQKTGLKPVLARAPWLTGVWF
jgi:hypothetical protein